MDGDMKEFIEEQQKNINQASQPKKFYSRDDTGNADRFMDMFGKNTLYNFPNSDFYNYDGKRWALDKRGIVRNKVDKVMDSIKQEPVFIPEGTTEKESQKFYNEHAKWIRKTRETRTKENLAKEIRHRIPVELEEFDSDIYALNCQNGWVDLRTGKLSPHDPKKMFSKVAGTNYVAGATSKRWEIFLNKIFSQDKEMVEFVQKLVGHALIGKNLEQIIIFLYGSGKNGKSVFLNVLEKLLGDYQTTIAANELMQRKNQGNGHSDSIAGLAGARMVTASEPEKGYHLSESVVKTMSGSDKIHASFKNKSGFTFDPQHVIFLACNYMPTMNSGASDDSIWRRVIIVPFEVTITEAERDVHLEEKLLKDLPAIMNWAIDGLMLYQKDGLVIPDKVARAMDEERESMDAVGTFLNEELVKVPNGKIQSSKVHEIYVLWNKAHGDKYPLSNRLLTQEIKARGYHFTKTNKGMALQGFSNREPNTIQYNNGLDKTK